MTIKRTIEVVLISPLLILMVVTDTPAERGNKKVATGGPSPVMSIVPYDDWITDDDARLALARLLSYREETLDASLKEYLRLLDRRPDHRDARLELAEIYLRRQMYHEAEQEVQKVLSMFPADRRAKLTAGRIHLRRGEYETAVVLFEQLREASPADGDIHLELARAYAWSGHREQAVTAYRQALAMGAHTDEDFNGEFGDALLAVGRREEALEQYRAALHKAPGSYKARKRLALALSWTGRDGEALVLLEDLFSTHREDAEIVVEMARIYIRNKQRGKALALLKTISTKPPADTAVMLAVADLEAAVGHAKKCRDLYSKVLSTIKPDDRLYLRYADRLLIWGDFYGAERIYKNHLKKWPEDGEVALKLAEVMVATDRYEEAEGIYRWLILKDRDVNRSLLGLASSKLREKDFDETIAYTNRLLAIAPNERRGLEILGDALFAKGKYEKALKAYQDLLREVPDAVPILLKLGKTYRRLGNEEKAREAFDTAFKKDPQGVETRFHRYDLAKGISDEFLKDIISSEQEAPDRLTAWARLFSENGQKEAALRCYRAALETDPEYFEAQIGLAETLAIYHQYVPAIDLYRHLAFEFPESSKILIGQARVLGWSRDYENSLALYEKLHHLNPADPLVQREKARVAGWANRREKAAALYEKMMTPPVDGRLLASLKAIDGPHGETSLSAALSLLEKTVGEGSVYQGYEAFAKEVEAAHEDHFPGKAQVTSILMELFPAYRIQKGADLEKRAKEAAWNRRYTQALAAYEELIRFNPGNEEALFDYGQIQCQLGLCDREKATYLKLLAFDPLHSLARQALDRQQMREKLSAEFRQSYWREDGRGDLARIKRHRSDISLQVPFLCSNTLHISGHRWIEEPEFTNQSYDADGFTVAFDGIVNPYLKGEAGWTHKVYKDDRFRDCDTGYAHLWVNVKDHFTLGAGFDRTNEIYNYFGLKQGIQADTWWFSTSAEPTRKLEIKGIFRYLDYNDSNNGQYHSLSIGYTLTDHPSIFKLIFSGDFRNTRHESTSSYASGKLVDITHPYWTPKNYFGGSVILEWYHDLSKLFFCGSEKHFYDLRASIGTDSYGNNAFRFEGEWLYEFYYRWTVGVSALIHRSREWVAEGLMGQIRYRF